MKSLQFKFPKYDKFKDKKLTVVFIDNGYFMYKQLEDAFTKRDHNVAVFKIKQNELISSSKYRKFVDDLTLIKPDFVFTINFSGFDKDGKLMAMLSSIEIPLFCYIVDSPFLIVQNNIMNLESSFLKLFVLDKQWIESIYSLFNNNIKNNINIYHLPIAINEEIVEFSESNFLEEPSTSITEITSKVNSSLFYHGHTYLDDLKKIDETPSLPSKIYKKEENKTERRIEDFSYEEKEIKSYFEEIKKDFLNELNISLHSKLQIKNIISIFESFELKNNLIFEFKKLETLLMIYYKLNLETDLTYRLNFFNSLDKFIKKSNLDLKIEGDNEWMNNLTLKIPIKSDIISHEQLLNHYNKSEFTLNLSSSLIPSSFNQKILETFICNGFIITDYRKDYDLILPKNYKYLNPFNKNSLSETIEHYQTLNTEKVETSKYAKNQIMKNHRYTNRVETIENIIMNGKW